LPRSPRPIPPPPLSNYERYQAARRASLKKSIAELQLLKAGGSVDIDDDAVTFNHPHVISDGETVVNSGLSAEERRQKFMMETILSER
jgi:hypothetical protein